MSDGPSGEPAVRLERPVRVRPSWLRRLLRLTIVCIGVAVIARASDIRLLDRGRACAAAVRGEQREAVTICQDAYDDTSDPAIGVLLARARYAADDIDGAARLARALLNTRRSDALHILGQVASRNDKLDDAVTALEQARHLHNLEHRPWEVADDAWSLAVVRARRSEFADALQLADECIKQAQLAGDMLLQRRGHLTAAKTLIRVGYWEAAERELNLASQVATTNTGLADVEYQRGSLYQEQAEHGQARAHFEKALRYNEGSQASSWTIATEINLAYSLAEELRTADAQHHLDEAAFLDPEHEAEAQRAWVAARIAYRRLDLASAASLVETYFKLHAADEALDRDEQLDVAALGARIELDRDDLERARTWAQQGVEQAERIRAAQPVLELRPSVLARRREPYELRFVALARSHQIESAVIAFNEWQGRTVEDAMVRSRPAAPLDHRGIADQITQLGAWLRVASQAPFAKSPDPRTVLRTMRDIDLLALIVADDRVWRLTAAHGSLRLDEIGCREEIRDLIDQFRGRPIDIELASELAARLVPDDVFRTTREALHVLIDGRLPPLPVAALRRGGTPLVAMRPIVHSLRLPETRCVHAMRSGHATVLGYSNGNIPRTQMEAEQVAALLHTTSEIGDAATKAALLSAAHDAVLHVAAHGDVGDDGSTLMLADGKLSALEISARRIAPSLAVLSACLGAIAVRRDFERAGSLVAGFLGAGSQHVVATLGMIDDSDAVEVATRFYRAGGVADPVRALQAAQSSLAKTNNVGWPYFAVFGPDVCPEDASRSR